MGELEREIEGRRDMGVVFFVMGFERRARRRSWLNAVLKPRKSSRSPKAKGWVRGNEDPPVVALSLLFFTFSRFRLRSNAGNTAVSPSFLPSYLLLAFPPRSTSFERVSEIISTAEWAWFLSHRGHWWTALIASPGLNGPMCYFPDFFFFFYSFFRLFFPVRLLI